MRITLVEGQYHQVKKMVGACGGYVQSLHRERIGAISLSAYPELREGSVMRAGPSEEALLRSMLPAHRVADSGPPVPKPSACKPPASSSPQQSYRAKQSNRAEQSYRAKQSVSAISDIVSLATPRGETVPPSTSSDRVSDRVSDQSIIRYQRDDDGSSRLRRYVVAAAVLLAMACAADRGWRRQPTPEVWATLSEPITCKAATVRCDRQARACPDGCECVLRNRLEVGYCGESPIDCSTGLCGTPRYWHVLPPRLTTLPRCGASFVYCDHVNHTCPDGCSCSFFNKFRNITDEVLKHVAEGRMDAAAKHRFNSCGDFRTLPPPQPPPPARQAASPPPPPPRRQPRSNRDRTSGRDR